MDPSRDAPGLQAGLEEGVGAAREEACGQGQEALRVGHLYGFARPRPRDGRVFWLILPAVNARALSRFAAGARAGEDKRVLLILDRASWHTDAEVEDPEGMHLEFLPARSSELQPAERLWPLVNERVAKRPFEGLDELEEALAERCLALSEWPGLIRGCTRDRWWPDAA